MQLFPSDPEVLLQQLLRQRPSELSLPVIPAPDYLGVAEKIIRLALPWQAADGRIIDPVEKREVNTATARFIGALGLLIQQGRCLDLLDQCAAALTPALQEMAKGEISWAEFIGKEAMMGLIALQPYAAQDQLAGWQELLAGLQPERCYFSCRPENGGGSRGNFVTFAIASEALRQYLKLAPESDFIDRMLEKQLPRFDENGMYRDPNCPMTYDPVARMNLTLARFYGYQGDKAAALDRQLQRGAAAQLLYQAPTGIMPFGGRSNQQNFNEVTFALLCEAAARRLAGTDAELAAVFRRAAALAMAAIQPYLRTETIHFSKNFFPSAGQLIHGREKGYGWYSPYTLLIASQLGFAALLADSTITPATAAPAEYGTYLWMTSRDFHRLFASCKGLQIQIELNADSKYDATGLGRIQRRNCPILLALAAPASAEPNFFTVSPPHRELAIGPESAGGCLAAQSGNDLHCEIKQISSDGKSLRFQLIYRTAQETFTEHYQLEQDQLQWQIGCEHPPIAARIPVLTTDGAHTGELEYLPDGFIWHWQGASYRVQENSGQAKISQEEMPAVNRNGIYQMLRFQMPGKQASFTIQLHPPSPEEKSPHLKK